MAGEILQDNQLSFDKLLIAKEIVMENVTRNNVTETIINIFIFNSQASDLTIMYDFVDSDNFGGKMSLGHT